VHSATRSEPGPTYSLATFAAQIRTADLPPEITRSASRLFANWMGCAIGAADDSSVTSVLQVASALSSREQASVVGRAERLDAVNAALVNGVSANALDYDDMHTPTLIHPSGPVVAAAFALGEYRHVPGATLLSSIVAGIEIECRLGLALFPDHYDAGWHITATLGTLGAAAAASVVLGLDAVRTAHAFGIAATQASGLRAMLANPCKSFNIGKAASAGVMSALLAEANFESAADVLEATHGLFGVFGQPPDVAAITRDLGSHYIVADVSPKPYPCGVVIHPLIDACLELTRNRAFRGADLRTITASVHPRAIDLAGRRHPETAITGRFSLYHAAALALTRCAAGLAAFDEADINDAELVEIRQRMVIEADPRLLPRQARVRVQLVDGALLEQAIDHPRGSPERPLTDTQLREKFVELARRAMDEHGAAELFETCLGLERVHDVAALRGQWVGS
jgi:2-methylcitrate dehydratase PrpD